MGAGIGWLTTLAENKALDRVFNNIAWVRPANIYIGLLTSAPNDAGGGTEVSEVEYQRQLLNGWTIGPSGTVTNDANVQFPIVITSWGTLTHFALYTEQTGGVMIAYGEFINAKTFGVNKQVRIVPGGVTIVSTGTWTNTLKDLVLDWIFNNTTWVPIATYMALYTAAPTVAGGGTEVAPVQTPPYARVPFSDWTAPSNGQISNASDFEWTEGLVNWGIVTTLVISDAATAGNPLAWSNFLTAEAHEVNDVTRITAGNLNIILD